MRGLSLVVLVVGVLFVGYLYQRTTTETAYTNDEPTTQYVEQQVKDVLQQYQTKLDQQAKEQ